MVPRPIGGYDIAMNSSLRRLALVLIAAAFLGLLTTGCQTTEGFGRDVENLGEKIEEKASN
jgi:predicted small secreted protein